MKTISNILMYPVRLITGVVFGLIIATSALICRHNKHYLDLHNYLADIKGYINKN